MMISLSLLLISAVLLAVKRNNAAGIRCGIGSMLFELAFSWFWFSAQSKGRAPWYELAFSRPMTIIILAAGLSLAIANAVIYYRKREDGYTG